jgi:hypothetical protein
MSQPVSNEYLACALAKQKNFDGMRLREKRIADLHLPTGKLVACDPFCFLGAEAFELPLPRGVFPVVLSVAHISNDQRVAFASIRFRNSTPVAWDMLTQEGQNTDDLKEGEIFCYGVDSGTGGFIDAAAAKELDRKISENTDFNDEMLEAMERTYVSTWSWLDMPIGKGNLIAFSSGYGDGAYATYVGFDGDSEICAVVTDFSVVPSQQQRPPASGI